MLYGDSKKWEVWKEGSETGKIGKVSYISNQYTRRNRNGEGAKAIFQKITAKNLPGLMKDPIHRFKIPINLKSKRKKSTHYTESTNTKALRKM